jgi:hypothetical protein
MAKVQDAAWVDWKEGRRYTLVSSRGKHIPVVFEGMFYDEAFDRYKFAFQPIDDAGRLGPIFEMSEWRLEEFGVINGVVRV